ncbi:MAG: glycine betaine ABC transporter substrate-binding protein [Thermodesulfobacteriota bacterium]|nr:glycine betaine ABC transporter substrate-binding protein [Thermodesulfobacteriota bacterium]
MKRKIFVFILGFIFFLLPANTLHSCVGRLLIVAVSNSPDQIIMGEMMSVLINERTGTTVNITQPGDLNACHEAVLEGKACIYISYIGKAQADRGGSDAVNNPQEFYTLVSQSFLEKFDMVWLKPFGFQGPLTNEAHSRKDRGTLAVPIATKDTLRKFPVLDRVINKLGNRIDNNIIEELREKTENQDVKKVVREFLKAQNLI